MVVAGIIAEYNPFHRGHAWQIAQTRERLGETGILCVMSGHWVQRGECAISDKWSRAALAVRGGADLVLELPTPWALSSAEGFGRGAVSVLSETGIVDVLSFGSESGAVEPLRRAAACLNSDRFRAELRRFLDQGLSFAACRQAAASEILGADGAACLSRPNDSLAVEYLRALPEGMAALAIPRIGGAHDGAPLAGYAPAGVLRALLRAGRLEEAVPYLTEPWTGSVADLSYCERAVLACLRRMELKDYQSLPDSGEGLAARLLSAARTGTCLEEVYALAKTKRYAHSRIRRMVFCAFLGLQSAGRPERIPYLRVLALNGRGQELLREMKKKASIPILTKPAHARRCGPEVQRLFELEARCTDLFALCFPNVRPGGSEWTSGPAVL